MKRHYSLLISLIFLAACSSQPQKADKPADASQIPSQPSGAAAAPAGVESLAPAPLPEPSAPEPKAARKEERVAPRRAAAPAPASVPAASVPQAAPQPVPANTTPQPVPQQQVAANAPVALPVPPPPAPPEPKKVTIPSGTQITVRMIDSIDSDSGHVGQAFRASMDGDLKVENDVVIPKGSDVFVKLIDVQSAGRMTGRSEVKVALDRLVVGRNSYPVQSNEYVQEAASQGTKTAKTVGVGSAIGAIIGGIAGGKKGAIIGAGAGAGGGAAVEAAQKSEQVHIGSETALVFRLESPIEVTVTPGANAAPTKNRFVPVP